VEEAMGAAVVENVELRAVTTAVRRRVVVSMMGGLCVNEWYNNIDMKKGSWSV